MAHLFMKAMFIFHILKNKFIVQNTYMTVMINSVSYHTGKKPRLKLPTLVVTQVRFAKLLSARTKITFTSGGLFFLPLRRLEAQVRVKPYRAFSNMSTCT